jgi:hypothetical protein
MNIFIILLLISSALAFVGYIWLVITGFRRNVFWGIMVLLFSPVTAIIFAMLNWFDAKRAFITFIIPAILMYGTMGYMYKKIGPANLSEINKRVKTGELKLNETMRVIDRAMNLQGSQKLFEPEPVAEQTDPATEDADMKQADGQALQKTTAETTDQSVPASDTEVAAKKMDTAAKQDNAQQKQDAVKTTTEEETDEKQESPPYPKLSQVKPDPLAVQKKQEDKDFVLVRFENVKNYKDRYFVIYTKQQTYLRGLLVKADNNALYLNRKLFGGSFEYRVSKNKINKIYMLKKEFIMERDRDRLPTP